MNPRVLASLVLLLLCSAAFMHLSYAGSAGAAPRLNDGKKWRIGYYEGGPYSDYTDTMGTLVSGLVDSGWIDDEAPPQLHGDIEKPYLDWLEQYSGSFLRFTEVDSYSAGWDDRRRVEIKTELIGKLKRGELDLVIAMGTWAGLDLANDDHDVPVMVLSTSNPIQAGIIKGAADSGFDHVTARIDPTRYLRQLRMFHRIVGFKTLGIAYEDTVEGRIYSALKDARQIAVERGFKIKTCKVLDTTPDVQIAYQSCQSCYRRLSREVDAVYVTALNCFDRNPGSFTEIFREAGIPSFSLVGSKYVQQGLLLSITDDSGYEELGRYNADKLGKILNGTPPGKLNQVFEDPLSISINMRTAKEIGFTPPRGILKIADRIYGD